MSKDKIMTVSDILVLETLLDKYGLAPMLNEMRFTKRQIAWLVGAGLLTATMLHNCKGCTDDPNSVEIVDVEKTPTNKYGVSDEVYQNILRKTELLEQEINRIEAYHNRTLDDIGFDVEYMVYLAYKYDMDLPLMFTQAQYETGLGLEGIGPKCNSLFSVGAYDEDPDRVYFKDYNSSIDSYIKLIKNDYLQNGKKTVDDLLTNGGFVNHNGDRYASDKQYEKKLRNGRDSLIRRYPELAEPFEG